MQVEIRVKSILFNFLVRKEIILLFKTGMFWLIGTGIGILLVILVIVAIVLIIFLMKK